MDIIVELLWRRVIVNFFGFYTLYIIFKIGRNKKGSEWLIKNSTDESQELAKGCLINIAGLASFLLFICAIAYLYHFWQNF